MTYSSDGWDFGDSSTGPGDEGRSAWSDDENKPSEPETSKALRTGSRTFDWDFDGPSTGPAGESVGAADRNSASGVTAPLFWLFVAGAAAVVSVLLGAWASFRPGTALVGWLVGGLGAISLVTVFTLKDAQLRTNPWYLERDTGRWLRLLVFTVALAGVALNGWRFADYISRIQVF